MKCRARTADDVEKARRAGEAEGIRKCIEGMLMISMLFLADKCGWRTRRLNRFWEFFMQYSDEMAKRNISVDDLREILKKEYDVNVKIQ